MQLQDLTVLCEKDLKKTEGARECKILSHTSKIFTLSDVHPCPIKYWPFCCRQFIGLLKFTEK